MPITPSHFKVIIVGGGSGGLSVAARLARVLPPRSIALFDPATTHYYQPLFTLIGGGEASLAQAAKPMEGLIPSGITWLRERVTGFSPTSHEIITDASRYQYDYLVVCPGIQINWQQIKGLSEGLGTYGVCSNYSEKYVDYTWQNIQAFKGGTALFTFPNTPVKCAGAPQKIMYLAEDYFRKNGMRDRSRIIFASSAASIFGVKKYANALSRIIKERSIETQFRQNLIAVDAPRQEALFENLDSGERTTIKFDLLHATPPMSAPDFIRQSDLASSTGWVDVDKHSLQHLRYPNVFALGDASSLPTSKTGAAIRKQAPILVDNLLAHMNSQPLTGHYDGYTSCPLVTAYGRLILAEFDYDGNPAETFPFDQSKERLSMYLLKKHVLPRLYWHGMLKGLA